MLITEFAIFLNLNKYLNSISLKAATKLLNKSDFNKIELIER